MKELSHRQNLTETAVFFFQYTWLESLYSYISFFYIWYICIYSKYCMYIPSVVNIIVILPYTVILKVCSGKK